MVNLFRVTLGLRVGVPAWQQDLLELQFIAVSLIVRTFIALESGPLLRLWVVQLAGFGTNCFRKNQHDLTT